MKSIDEASAEILAAFAPIGTERVPLLSALGRFSSEPFSARADAPPFDNSAMDGYALRAADVAGASEASPVTLPVIGESRAGGPAPAALAEGAAMRIFTGAMMPADADAVVLQEDTLREGERVHVRFAVAPRANVRLRGSDLRAGALALPAHTHVGPGEIALLASQDVASVCVFRKPRVAILSTGDELRDIGEPPRPGSIVSSNSYALAAQVSEAGADPWVLPPVRDERSEAARAIREGLAADVLVISGGVSVGDYDVVRTALSDLGIELAFWKVEMKPGKPVSFARHGRVPVLGLPGNPVSAFVTFELFVRPGLRKMLGEPRPHRPRVRVTLAAPLTKKPGRTELARAKLTTEGGQLVAHLAQRQGSGSIPSITFVDALVLIPGEMTSIDVETPLEALLLGRHPG